MLRKYNKTNSSSSAQLQYLPIGLLQKIGIFARFDSKANVAASVWRDWEARKKARKSVSKQETMQAWKQVIKKQERKKERRAEIESMSRRKAVLLSCAQQPVSLGERLWTLRNRTLMYKRERRVFWLSLATSYSIGY